MTEKEKALELIGKYQKHAMLKDLAAWILKLPEGAQLLV